jgi:hypothetical protein
VVGLLVSQLAALGHLVLVRHARCEHGAWVHVRHDAAPAVPAVAAARDRHTAAAGPSGRAEGEHEHCDALALRPALAEVDASCVVPELIAATLLPFDAGPRTGERPVPILTLAPKSSPPG